VVSNKADAYALTRAQNLGIDTAVMPKADFKTKRTVAMLRQYESTLLYWLGSCCNPRLSDEAFPHKMLNLHPLSCLSLVARECGDIIP
jgi:phosphoribosylglycinamide formyltransferase-1